MTSLFGDSWMSIGTSGKMFRFKGALHTEYDKKTISSAGSKELGKNALSRLCGMQKTASLNFCTPCELSWGNAFFPGP